MTSDFQCKKCGSSQVSREKRFDQPDIYESEKGQSIYYILKCLECGVEWMEHFSFTPDNYENLTTN